MSFSFIAGCLQALEEALLSSGEIAGTLQITFIHTEPDLRQEIPPIPG